MSDARDFEPIDFLLKQGDADELAEMRRAIGEDPMLALDLADTVQVVEQFRQLRTEPSARFACNLAGLHVRAERRLHPRAAAKARRAREPRRMPWVGALAAAASFAALMVLDPLATCERGERAPATSPFAIAAVEPLEPAAPTVDPPLRAEVEWDQALATIGDRLSLERSSRLRAAFDEGLRRTGDALAQWLEPTNAMVLLRLDHELRASAELRARALEQHGGLAAVDARVQELADGIAFELDARALAAAPQPSERALAELAYGVRALIAAGSTSARVDALRRGGDLLAERLPELHGARLVTALAGLVELASVTGRHFEAVARHGHRLVDEVLVPDEVRWARSRPELLSGNVDAGTLGEAGRILARLPAFGVDIERCRLTRRLVLGQLREQRDRVRAERGQDRPEELAAMLYGCADLLEQAEAEAAERDRLQLAVRRWTLARLAPDFVTAQQLAWSLRPGDRGFARRQQQLRELAILPIPADLQARAAFCLCLATNYAGFVGALTPSGSLGRDV